MQKSADFEIRPGQTVYLHQRPWRQGQEGELQAKGFTLAEKAQQARRGALVWSPGATESARTLAEAEGVDLALVPGTGQHGRVTKGDVEDHLRARRALAAGRHPRSMTEAQADALTGEAS